MPEAYTHSSKSASFLDYVAIARPDHWFKNVFMVPGMILAFVFFPTALEAGLIFDILIGVIATCLIASANYVINEWLDQEFDRYHPVKKHRPSVAKNLNVRWVYFEYALLSVAGLGLSALINLPFFLAALLLLVMGFLYNVKPFRTKDRVYLDVISESINNPIRLALGWFIIAPVTTSLLTTLPPASMVFAYWMGGAFLMATKRFAEYRFIDDQDTAGLYRRSFKHYTEINLLVSVFFYALTCTFFLGIFLIKHRIELLLSFPFFALMFAWYLKIAFWPDSPVQRPEKLYSHTKFMIYLLFLATLVVVLFKFDIPWMHNLLKNTFG